MNNIVLIGMPGAGKSTIGVVLAKTLGMTFVDSDLVIQEIRGALLQDIINEHGMAYFLDAEEQAIMTITGSNRVIATGGSVIYREGAMAHLKDVGNVIYLKVGYGEIERRVNNIRTRGIAIKEGASLRDVYVERTALYEAYMDEFIECEELDVEDIVAAIGEKIAH